MARVLVIDDGEVGRLGRAAALDAAGHRTTAMGWEEAGRLSARTRSARFDLVLAGLRPDPTSWDRYSAIGTLRELGGVLEGPPELVALLWGRAVTNPLLGLRLARAGVSRVVEAGDASTIEELDRLVTSGTGRSPLPDSLALALAGVGPGCDPEAVMAWVEDRASDPEAGPAYLRAFDPNYAQNTCGLSRRKAHNLRVRLARLADIPPASARSAGGPHRDTSLARWAEVVGVVNACRGLETVERTYDLGAEALSMSWAGSPTRARATAGVA